MKKLALLAAALLSAFTAAVAETSVASTTSPQVTTSGTASVSVSTSSATQILGDNVLPAISSPSALRAYALKLVTDGNSQVYGNGVQGQGGNTFVWASGSSPNDIIEKLNAKKFTFTLLDPSKDEVNVWAQLSTNAVGSYPHTLFTGYAFAGSAQEDSEGKLFVPTPRVPFQLSWEIPVFVGANVDYSSLWYRDDSGQIQWGDNMRVENGWMFFQGQYAGKGGQVVLYNKDGTQRVVDIETGREVVQQNVAMGVKAGLNNYIEVNDSAMGGVVGAPAQTMPIPFSPNSSWFITDAPVVRVELGRARPVAIHTGALWNGSYSEAPVVTAHGPNGQVVQGMPDERGFFLLQTSAPGVWWISFEYETLFGEDTLPSPPYYGGKG